MFYSVVYTDFLTWEFFERNPPNRDVNYVAAWVSYRFSEDVNDGRWVSNAYTNTRPDERIRMNVGWVAPGFDDNRTEMHHNTYFGGSVQSLRFPSECGEKSVGVMAPGEYSFTTSSAEHVEILTGALEFRMNGVQRVVAAGASYDVPPQSTFTVVCSLPVSYLCHFREQACDETGTRLKPPPILERTPILIQAIIDGLDPAIQDWRPSAERWSVRMVVAHLAEAEVSCFRSRLRQAAFDQGDMPLLSPYDQWAIFRDDELPETACALHSFGQEREISLTFLRSLPTTVLTRRCRHENLGVLSFQEMLNEFAFHDMGHIRQILELCRAREYYPNMGGWRGYYQVNP